MSAEAHTAVMDGIDDGGIVRPTQVLALADVLAVLQLCRAGRLRCSERTQRPSAATVTAVASVRPAATDREGPHRPGKPPAETIRGLWRSWISKAVIDELSCVEHIKGQRTTNTLTSARTRRQTVATALAGRPAEQWVQVDDLFTRMQRDGLSPSVARSERALWRLYLTDPEYGSLGHAGFADWPILEGRYTLAVLFEYAGTLGLFDLDYSDPAGARDDFRSNWGTDELDYLSRYDGLRALRLNALGAYALGLTDRYQPPAASEAAVAGALKVLPNLDIVVTGELPPADRLTLDAYAQRTADRVWALREATLLAAIDTGRGLDQLRAFLTARATHELPNPVTTLLADITARAGRLRNLGMVRLVECADPPLAALITNDRRLHGTCPPKPRPDGRPSPPGRIRPMQPTRNLTRPASRASVYQMAYFPPDQYEQAWAQGLLNATSYRDHGDYRRETEQTMQALADRGAIPIHVVRMTVADLLAYAQRAGKDPAARQTRLAYTGWLHETGHTGLLWPPERNSPCWCGSGTKYKKCCGNPVFLAVEPPDPASLILRIDLDGVTPTVWRRVAIPSNTTLDVVHRMIQDAMGWYDEHMYVFETDEHTIIDPRSTSGQTPADGERLVSIATDVGATFTYVYDFGDEWRHTVTVEEIHPGGPGNVFTVLDGGGACPPEDVGGADWYQHLLGALADPTSADHDDAVERLGEDFDPTNWRGGTAGQG